MLLLFPTTCSLINLQCQISERVQGVRQRCQILISREVLINMGVRQKYTDTNKIYIKI